MAERPIKDPLPADLPENWQAEQIVAPTGEEAGLTHQHGYNYLMEMVNRAQRGVNSVNEAFDTVSGKRTCRFVVGTSTAGWTAADCDYLCDGTDDQEEIQAAIDALPKSRGEIFLLDGEYVISEDLNFGAEDVSVTISGTPGATTLKISSINLWGYLQKISVAFRALAFTPIQENEPARIMAQNIDFAVLDCALINTSLNFYETSGSSFSFLCAGNTFLLVGTLNIPGNLHLLGIETSSRASNNCIACQNSFQVEADVDSRTILVNIDTYPGNNVLFSNNTVHCNAPGWDIRPRDGGTLVGNSFSGVDVTLTNSASFSSNKMYSGTLYGIGDNGTSNSILIMAITGNTLENTDVKISGNLEFSGNFVHAPDGKAAVTLYKSAPNANPDYSPAVVGNFIIGGTTGIHLYDKDGTIPQSPDIGRAVVNSNKILGSSTPIQLDAHWSSCMVTDNLFITGSIIDNGTNNIIRNNSDDTGGGAGGAFVSQAVPSISVAEGGLVTASATQTAGNVAAGTKSTTHQLSAQDDPDLIPENIREGVSVFGVRGTMQAGTGGVTSETVAVIVTLTEAEYNALSAKDPSTLYLIKE